MMKEFTGAIFDLDGTLLDSMWVWEQIDVDFLSRRGIDLPEDYLKKSHPWGLRRRHVIPLTVLDCRNSPEI